jgi:hypothetical protein
MDLVQTNGWGWAKGSVRVGRGAWHDHDRRRGGTTKGGGPSCKITRFETPIDPGPHSPSAAKEKKSGQEQGWSESQFIVNK